MKRLRRWSGYWLGGSLLAIVGTIGLSMWVSILSREIRTLRDDEMRRSTTGGAALGVQSSPGLGEFMTTMQLHMGKLWFAGKADNWDLARYELDELREAMEAAQNLHSTKNGVDVSKVLDAVAQSQVSQLATSIEKKNRSNFTHAYDEALSACNGCHEESGHRFIKIARPTAPPVSNQRWNFSG
jgi:cytochrome c553